MKSENNNKKAPEKSKNASKSEYSPKLKSPQNNVFVQPIPCPIDLKSSKNVPKKVDSKSKVSKPRTAKKQKGTEPKFDDTIKTVAHVEIKQSINSGPKACKVFRIVSDKE